jgi:hypothetical protein
MKGSRRGDLVHRTEREAAAERRVDGRNPEPQGTVIDRRPGAFDRGDHPLERA